MTRGRFVATRRANALDDVWLATIKSHSAVLPVAVFLHAVRTEDTLERPPARTVKSDELATRQASAAAKSASEGVGLGFL
jgi:hypothetical protein